MCQDNFSVEKNHMSNCHEKSILTVMNDRRNSEAIVLWLIKNIEEISHQCYMRIVIVIINSNLQVH